MFYKIVDLSSFSSIKQFAEHYISNNTRLDVLVNNAGIVSPTTPATEQGVETTIGINYLGHFYLVHLLKDLLLSAAGRVVVVASDAYKFGRGKITTELLQGDSPEFFKPVDSAGIKEYGASNVARVMFAQEFVKRYPTVKCVSLHPGVVKTNLARNGSKLFKAVAGFILYPFSKNPEVGAKTSIHCAIEEIGDEENGGYFVNCKQVELLDHVKDTKLQEMLWDVSMKVVEKFDASE